MITNRYSTSPAKALWNFTQAIQWKQERGVAVATQASQEVLCGLQALLRQGLLVHHGNGVEHKILKVLS